MEHGDPYIQKGLKALKDDAIDQAVSWFKQSVQQTPSADGLHLLGMALHKSGDSESALEALTKSIELSPQNSTLYLDRGQILASCKHPELAEQDYSLAILLKKENAEAYFRRGLLFLDQDLYDKAEKDFKIAISLNSDHPFFIGGLGKLYMAKKDYASAIDTFQDALSVEPEFFDALRLIGEAYIGLENYEQAIDIYKKCVVLDPNSDGIILRLGWLYAQTNNILRAFDCFYTISQRHPFKFQQLLPSVRESFEQHEWKNFQKDLYKKISTGSSSFDDLLSMAMVQECLIEEKVALDYYSQALKQKLTSLLAASRVVELSIKYNATALALPLIKQVYDELPENRDACFLLARLHEHLGQNDASIELLNEAIELDSTHYLIYFHLGNLYLKEKKFELAKKNYKQCLTHRRNFAPCFYSLSCLFGLQNKFPQGLKMINAALKLEKRPEHYIQKAKLYIGMENLKDAKKIITSVLSKYPSFEPAIQLGSFLGI